MRAIVLILLLLPLAACGLFENKEIRTLRKSPDYRAGYQDGGGCVEEQCGREGAWDNFEDIT